MLPLTLSTDNDQLSRTYRIKGECAQRKTDSLIWGDKAISKLPSRLPDPRNQKSIDFNNRAVSLIEENDGTYTFATSDNLFESTWQKNAATFPFTPNVRSLCATTSRLLLLATDGKMYESADGSSRTATGETWTAMLGSYLDTAIGIRNGANGAEYAQYPQKNLNVCAIDPEFPVSGYSNFVILENQWTSSPVGFFAGGTCADGSLSDATWAFDGYNWIKLAEGRNTSSQRSVNNPILRFPLHLFDMDKDRISGMDDCRRNQNRRHTQQNCIHIIRQRCELGTGKRTSPIAQRDTDNDRMRQ